MGAKAHGPTVLGYHARCGGPVARVKVDGGKYDSLKCSRCRTVVPPADIEATPFPTVRQSTAGVRARARRRRFDYANWDEV